ncbi:MAG: hypothetical protein ACYDCQ_09300 [Dehalococcoidia bacterium]
MRTMNGYPFAEAPAHEAIAVQELRLPPNFAAPRIVEQRRRACSDLDAMVRRGLPRVAPGMFAAVQPPTIYDAVYPATPEIGGHWSIASTWMGLFTHTISSYTVALAFDDEQRPHHFIVSGAREISTPDASEASLTAALAASRAYGPLRTSAMHVFPGFAL